MVIDAGRRVPCLCESKTKMGAKPWSLQVAPQVVTLKYQQQSEQMGVPMNQVPPKFPASLYNRTRMQLNSQPW
jgi:hypothetical protein